jgi:hypothetical protein
MEIQDILIKANEAVNEAALPEEFRLKAFELSVIHIFKADSNELVTSSSQLNPSTSEPIESLASPKSVISKIAFKLKLNADKVEEVFYMDGDDLKIIVGTSKLDQSIAGATKEIALLTAGGMQLGDLEEWTTTDSISEQCEYFGKYDSSNFAKTIKAMDTFFSYTGTSHNRKIKIIRPGIEKLRELIMELTT